MRGRRFGARPPAVAVKAVKDGEVVAEGEALPGDKVADVARQAKVTLPATCMMKANGQDVQVSAETSRVPAPERRNLVTDEEGSEMMDSVRPPCHHPSASRKLLRLYCRRALQAMCCVPG